MHFSGVPSLLQSHPEILKEAYFGS